MDIAVRLQSQSDHRKGEKEHRAREVEGPQAEGATRIEEFYQPDKGGPIGHEQMLQERGAAEALGEGAGRIPSV
jgi:hypothetical protein